MNELFRKPLWPIKRPTAVSSDGRDEGKTKIITPCHGHEDEYVIITNKDTVTAQNGKRTAEIPGKGALSTRMTVNVLKFLERRGIQTHHIDPVGEIRKMLLPNQFLAERLATEGIEVVSRGIAAGSFLKRNPEISPGKVFDFVAVEFYLKDDELGDPIMEFDFDNNRYRLFNAADPVATRRPVSVVDIEFAETVAEMRQFVEEVTRMARETFLPLRRAFDHQKVALVDMKTEFGWTSDGFLILADVLDFESMRLWPDGDPSQSLDKEYFRSAEEITPAVLDETRRRYFRATEITELF